MEYKTPTRLKCKLFVVVLIVFSTSVTAQTKNKIGVHIGTYHFYNVLTSHEAIPSQLGLSYERRVSDRFALVAAYTRAPFYFISKRVSMHGKYKPMTTEEYDDDMASIGKLHTRFNYNYFDLGALYTLFRHRRHSLRADASLSLAYGLNTYKTNLVLSPVSPEGWTDIVYMEKDYVHEAYFGGLLGLQYQYEILSDKLSVSAMVRGRFYAGNFPFQMNYGLQAAFHF